MKKYGKLIISLLSSLLFLICISCSNLTPTNKYGVVVGVKKMVRYDPVIHMYSPWYKYQIAIDDTIVSYSTRTRYDIGDSIKYILY